jgi:ParB family chromosome partitioning protein
MIRSEKFIPDFPIAQLSPGHTHPFAAANPRKSGHDTDIEGLAHSIHEQGVLQPLRVFPKEDGSGDAWVYIGERRLLASQMNLDRHADGRTTVPVLWVENITAPEAFRESLVEQVNRLPLHAIEQFEAFAECGRQGMSEKEIAEYFTIKVHVVRQRLRLGDIAPEIRQAWRDGQIDQDCAQEFARLTNPKDQLKLFQRQQKSHGLYAQAIRSVLVPDQGRGAAFVNFVGRDAYEARGGKVLEDLFNGVHGVTDPALAAEMAQERLEVEALRLTSMEGWKWARRADDMPAMWRSYEQVEPKAQLTVAEKDRLKEIDARIRGEEIDDTEADLLKQEAEDIQHAADMRAFTAKQKAKSGCVVSVSLDGNLAVTAGVIMPEPVAETKEETATASTKVEGDDATPEEPAPRLSNAQASDLATVLTEGAALAVAGNFNMAMAIALAAFAVNSDGLPARLRHNGLGANTLKLTNHQDFGSALKGMLKLKPQQREALFAQVVAASLKFDSFSAERHAMTDPDVATLVNAVDPKVMQAMLLKRFDPDVYFAKAPKAFALVAIEDVFGRKEAEFSASTGKQDLVAYAVENCPPAKWLPIELRPEGYAGPGAKKKPASKAAAKKAVKKGKR